MFSEVFPQYLSYGMPYDEYWNGDPSLAKAYRKKHYIDMEERNYELWLQGLYNYNALSVVVGNALAKRGAKKLKYLEDPIKLFPKTAKERKEEAEKERQRLINQLNMWASSWNAKHKDVKEHGC